MANRKITSKQYFKTLKFIHVALILGVIMFASFVSFLLSGQDLITDFDPDANIYYVIIGMFGLIALFGGDILFKNMVRKAKIQPALSAKMMQYQSANIIKYALLEGVALFGVVATLLTLSVWFLVISVILLIVLASYHPGIEKAIKDLELNVEEQKQVKNPDAYISEAFDNQ